MQVLLPCSPDCTSQQLCSHHCFPSHSPAVHPCSQQHPGALGSSVPLPSHPCSLSWGQCPKLLLAVTSRRRRRRGSSCQLCVPTCTGTLQLLCCTHRASTPWEPPRNCSWHPWVRQGHHHSQGKCSHLLQRVTCLRSVGSQQRGKSLSLTGSSKEIQCVMDYLLVIQWVIDYLLVIQWLMD